MFTKIDTRDTIKNMENEYTLQLCGHIYNPTVWKQYPFYMTNRIHFIISGTAYYRETKLLKKDHMYIFPMNPAFMVSQDPSDPVDHIFFDFRSYTNNFFTDMVEIDCTKVPGLLPLMESFRESVTDWDLARKYGPSYFQTIVALIKDYIPVNMPKSAITQSAVDFIHSADVRELTVSSIAEHINVNEDHFIRCFRKDMGYTPHKYIAMYKADMAARMILAGKNISEAADALGFSSVSSFSTFFKNERNIAPSEVRTLNFPPTN